MALLDTFQNHLQYMITYICSQIKKRRGWPRSGPPSFRTLVLKGRGIPWTSCQLIIIISPLPQMHRQLSNHNYKVTFVSSTMTVVVALVVTASNVPATPVGNALLALSVEFSSTSGPNNCAVQLPVPGPLSLNIAAVEPVTVPFVLHYHHPSKGNLKAKIRIAIPEL